MIVEHLSQKTSTSTMTIHDISQRFAMHVTLPNYISLPQPISQLYIYKMGLSNSTLDPTCLEIGFLKLERIFSWVEIVILYVNPWMEYDV